VPHVERQGQGGRSGDAADGFPWGGARSTGVRHALRDDPERFGQFEPREVRAPMENDVVRLVSEGLGNKDIGARLFISPRTVQTHLTHVYAKLGLTSRVQLVQEAGRRA